MNSLSVRIVQHVTLDKEGIDTVFNTRLTELVDKHYLEPHEDGKQFNIVHIYDYHYHKGDPMTEVVGQVLDNGVVFSTTPSREEYHKLKIIVAAIHLRNLLKESKTI